MNAGGSCGPPGTPMCMKETIAKAAHAVGAHRITTAPSTKHVQVEVDGQVVADTTRAVELDETRLPVRYYLPPEDVRTDLLTPSDTRTHCPFKGDASYRSLGDAVDAFWVYEAPDQPNAEAIRGMLAPDPRKVTVLVDGVPLEPR